MEQIWICKIFLFRCFGPNDLQLDVILLTRLHCSSSRSCSAQGSGIVTKFKNNLSYLCSRPENCF